MSASIIRVQYSCALCGLKRAICDVPARGDEDVTVWMEQTIRTVGAEHARRSPGCHPETLTDMRIPIAGTDHIGGPVVN